MVFNWPLNLGVCRKNAAKQAVLAGTPGSASMYGMF